ncbi:MAG: M1 family peptidase [Bacteroidetes bacterium]|nr:MAG: M1 family peptidase [Bacteroidota bacterium]TAE64840.1 MAG: M1 family peptidase [Bacteroidota bacterium]
MKWKSSFLLFSVLVVAQTWAQPDRWQQRVKYQMDVVLQPQNHVIKGQTQMEYWNNSPDTLYKLFFHAYWNAFQPNSMMDVRSRELGKTVLGTNRRGETILDWDARVRDRIQKLTPEEQGYQRMQNVVVNGEAAAVVDHETILEITLAKPILPKSKSTIKFQFEAQVPIQIRRSGRNSAEGVQYSMAQWYPKLAEYDYQGWHPNFYVAREFYGVWGDYNVNITVPSQYTVAGSGTLQNPNQVRKGYETSNAPVASTMPVLQKWQFVANNVHDFVWAADTAYRVIKKQVANGPLVYVVHKQGDAAANKKWNDLLDTAVLAYPYMAKHFGAYPYANYSFIQGGDGGMEYPMATLIRNASIGTAIHEWMHTWYQMLMGTNESLYGWMDEGFTSYAESRTLGKLRGEDSLTWLEGDYAGYFDLAKSGREEPMATHADFFNTNYAYTRAAYTKGAVFIAQLGYIIGEKNLDKLLLEYYKQWRFKHPNPTDFVRLAEKVSGQQLSWYKELMMYTTKKIDYALGDITVVDGKLQLTVKRIGDFPMPIEVELTLKSGAKTLYYIPLNLQLGSKPNEGNIPVIKLPEWKWTHPTYTITLPVTAAEIKSIIIDPSRRLADLNPSNNQLVLP